MSKLNEHVKIVQAKIDADKGQDSSPFRNYMNQGKSYESKSLNILANNTKVASTNMNNRENKLAIQKVKPGDVLATYDIEALGTPSVFKKSSPDAKFNINEFAVQFSKVGMNGEIIPQTSAESFLVKTSEEALSTYGQHIERLKSNPSYINSLSKDVVRSLEDLALYDNTAKFGVSNVLGKELPIVKSQAERKYAKGPLLNNADNIRRMEEGLNNLKTKSTSLDVVMEGIGATQSKMGGNLFFLGQNNQNYDKPAVMEVFKGLGIKNDSQAGKVASAFSSPQLDILPQISTTMTNRRSEIGVNNKLSTLADRFLDMSSIDSKSFHMGAFDVEQTTGVAGKVGFPFFQKTNNKTTFVDNQASFIAQKGLNEYGMNANTFFDVSVKNKDGKYVPSRNGFVENPFVKGREYILENQFDNLQLEEGIAHKALMFRDIENDRLITLGSKNVNDLQELVDSHLINSNTKEGKVLQQEALQDRARRRLDRVFSGSDNFGASPIEAYDRFYSDLDEVSKTISILNNPKATPEEIGRETAKRLNLNKDVPYDTSPHKFAELAVIRDRAYEEKPFFDKVKERAQQEAVATQGNTKDKTRAQKTVFKSYYDTLKEVAPDIEKTEKKSGVATWVKRGKKSQINIADKNNLKKELSIAANRRGKVATRKNDLIEMVTSIASDIGMPETDAFRFAAMIEEDFSGKQGAVGQNLIDEIVDNVYLYKDKAETEVKKNTMKLDGRSKQAKMNKQLANGVPSEHFMNIQNEAQKRIVAERNHSVSNMGSNTEIVQKLTSGKEAVSKSEKAYNTLIESVGLQSKVKKRDIGQEINKVQNAFHKEKFSTTFLQSSEGLTLFFDASGKDLGSMTPTELMKSPSIGQLKMPLMDDRFLIDIGGDKVINGFKAENYKGNYQFSTTQSRAFDIYSRMPEEIRKAMIDNEAQNLKMSTSDIIENQLSRSKKRIVGTQETITHAGATVEKIKTSNGVKNLQSGTQVDLSSLANDWLKDNHYSIYMQYMQEAQNPNVPFFLDDKFSIPYKEGGNKNIKNGFLRDKIRYAEEKIGLPFTEMVTDTSGGVNNWGSGKARAKFQKLIPGGEGDAAFTEVSEKSLNVVEQDTEKIRQALKAQGYSETQIQERLLTSRTPLVNSLFPEEQRGVNVSNLDIADIEVNRRLKEGIDRNDKQLTIKSQQLKEELKKSPKARNEYEIKKLEQEISQLESLNANIQKHMNTFTTYDGMATVRESALAGLEKKDIRTLALKEEEKVSDDLMKALQKSEEFNKMFKDQPFDGTQSFRLENPIALKDLNLKEQGKLTIGELSKYEIQEDGKSVIKRNQRGTTTKIHENEASILGFDYDPKTKTRKLVYETSNTAEQGGFKVIAGNHNRFTVSVVPDEVMDIVSKSADMISPNSGPSKHNSSQFIVGSLNQVKFDYMNLLEEASKDAGIVNNSPDLQNFLKANPQITAKDLNQAEIKERFLNTVYKDKLSHIGLEDKVSIDKNTRLLIDSDLLTDNQKLLGEDGFSNLYQGFRASAYEGMGKKDEMMHRYDLKVHDIYNWQGNVATNKTNRKYLETVESQLGEDSLTLKTLIGLSKDSKSEKAISMHRQISNHLGTSNEVETSSKIFLDFAGALGIDADTNSIMNPDGSVTIGLSDVKQVGKETSLLKAKNSTLDISNLEIRTGGEKITLQDIVNANGNVSIYGQLPDDPRFGGAKSFPIISAELGKGFDDDFVISKEFKKQEINMIKGVEEYTRVAKSAGYSEEVKNQKLDEIANSILQSKQAQQEAMSKYVTGEKGFYSDMIVADIPEGNWKANTTFNLSEQYSPKIHTDKSGNKSISWINDGKLKEGYSFVNSKSFEDYITPDTIEGISEHLGVNQKFTAQDLANNTVFKEAKENIIKEMNTNPDAYIFALETRYPVNTKDTVGVVKVQIDNSLKNNETAMGAGFAKVIHGDFDGDNIAKNTVMYRLKGEDLQKELQRLEKVNAITSKLSVEAGSAIMQEEFEKQISAGVNAKTQEYIEAGMDANKAKIKANNDILTRMEEQGSQYPQFDSMRDMMQQENRELIGKNFKPHNTAEDEIQSAFSNVNKSSIGQIDNVRDRYQQSINTLKKAADSNPSTQNLITEEARNDFEKFFANLSQDNISAKKTDLAKRFPGMTGAELEAKAIEANEALDATINSIRNIRIEKGEVHGVQRTKESLMKMGIVSDENDELLQQLDRIAPDIARVNQNEEYLGKLSAYSGQGTSNSDRIKEAKSASNVPLNKVKYDYTAGTKNEQDAIRKATMERTENIIENLEASKGVNVTTDVFSKAKVNKVIRSHEMGETMDVGMDIFTSQKKRAINQMYNTGDNAVQKTKKAFKDVADSSFAKGTVAFASVWAASALFRKAPTPEGNEAQQEATPQQVNPSALLTSPTARVAQNNESINLSISATGDANTDHNEVAAIVQNQIAAMTGTQMGMNINVSDNTTSLSTKWYQDKISSVFGV